MILGETNESNNKLWKKVAEKATHFVKKTELIAPSLLHLPSIPKSALLASKSLQRDYTMRRLDSKFDLFDAESPRRQANNPESMKTIPTTTEEMLLTRTTRPSRPSRPSQKLDFVMNDEESPK